MRAALRKLIAGTALVGIVSIGLIAQGSSYLLGFDSPGSIGVGQPELEFAEVGPHPVGVRGLEVAGLEATVWYPALDSSPDSHSYPYSLLVFGADVSTAIAAQPGRAKSEATVDPSRGPYPLVVLSHGYAITASSYGWLAEHLASHGMVVVAPHHSEVLDPRQLWRSTITRPRDIDRVVETIPAWEDTSVFPGSIVDIDRTAVVGHSYGGYTALAAAGARLDMIGFAERCAPPATPNRLEFLCDALVPYADDIAGEAGLESVPPGLWPARVSTRVDAAVSLAGDAAMFGESGLAEIDVPLLVIGGTADTDSPFEWGSQFAYDHVSSERKVEVRLDGAGHFVYAGECSSVRRVVKLMPFGFCTDDGWDRADAHTEIKHRIAAFLYAELGGDDTAAANLTEPSGDLRVRIRSEGYAHGG